MGKPEGVALWQTNISVVQKWRPVLHSGGMRLNRVRTRGVRRCAGCASYPVQRTRIQRMTLYGKLRQSIDKAEYDGSRYVGQSTWRVFIIHVLSKVFGDTFRKAWMTGSTPLFFRRVACFWAPCGRGVWIETNTDIEKYTASRANEERDGFLVLPRDDCKGSHLDERWRCANQIDGRTHLPAECSDPGSLL